MYHHRRSWSVTVTVTDRERRWWYIGVWWLFSLPGLTKLTKRDHWSVPRLRYREDRVGSNEVATCSGWRGGNSSITMTQDCYFKGRGNTSTMWQCPTRLLFIHHIRIPGRVSVSISMRRKKFNCVEGQYRYFCMSWEYYGTHKLHKKMIRAGISAVKRLHMETYGRVTSLKLLPFMLPTIEIWSA